MLHGLDADAAWRLTLRQRAVKCTEEMCLYLNLDASQTYLRMSHVNRCPR